MVCAVCVWVLTRDNGSDLTAVVNDAAPAVTAVRGTMLCAEHAVEKLRHLPILQEIGVR